MAVVARPDAEVLRGVMVGSRAWLVMVGRRGAAGEGGAGFGPENAAFLYRFATMGNIWHLPLSTGSEPSPAQEVMGRRTASSCRRGAEVSA